MKPLTDNQRKRAATILTNVGTVIFAGIVIGQIIEKEKFNTMLFISGVIFIIICFLLAIYYEPY